MTVHPAAEIALLPGRLRIAVKFVQEHPTLSTRESARQAGVSTMTITHARQWLAARGEFEPLPHTRSFEPVSASDALSAQGPPPDQPLNDIPRTLEEFQARFGPLLEDPRASSDQKRRVLLDLFNITKQAGGAEEIGPGEPKTDEERIFRTTLILEANGTVLARQAWLKAFHQEITETRDIPQPKDADEQDAQAEPSGLVEGAENYAGVEGGDAAQRLEVGPEGDLA